MKRKNDDPKPKRDEWWDTLTLGLLYAVCGPALATLFYLLLQIFQSSTLAGGFGLCMLSSAGTFGLFIVYRILKQIEKKHD